MKALKHPLAVRDNDGNEYRVNSFHYDPDWKEELIMTQMPNGEFISWIIGQDCQWVEAELYDNTGQSVTDNNQVKNGETCATPENYGTLKCTECSRIDLNNYTPKQINDPQHCCLIPEKE